MPGDVAHPAISSLESDTGIDWDRINICSSNYHLLAAGLFACDHHDISPLVPSIPVHKCPGRISSRILDSLGKAIALTN